MSYASDVTCQPLDHSKCDSPVAKGVWHDKLGGNLPSIWISTIMSKVSKKIGCQEKFFLWMCILQTRITTDQVFLCSYWNQVICYELAHKIKTTCQISHLSQLGFISYIELRLRWNLCSTWILICQFPRRNPRLATMYKVE